MDFWREHRPMTGIQVPNVEKVQCRYCAHAEKEHIGRGYCEEYPEGTEKPAEVLFEDAPCPKFKQGEDLLKYEIEI